MKGTFRSLNNTNYRMWAAGAIVSNVGTWMQRTAQDWIVLTALTHQSATAVGVVMALQFGPFVLLLPVTGLAADRFDRRKLLMATQAAMGVLALGLGVLTVSGAVQLWHVYAIAFLQGCVTALDSAVRQTFVAELVGEADLANAVALNSASFNAARLIGPAIAGVLIAAVGSGWVFLINAASFIAVLCSLYLLRADELHLSTRAAHTRGSFADGFRYVWNRPDLKILLVMFFLIGTFGANFPIFISTMSVVVFHAGADQFGLLTSIMAVGSVAGALLTARREKPDIGVLLAAAAVLGCGFALAAITPSFVLFGVALVVIGVSVQTFTTSSNSLVQLSTAPAMRGRVMAILLAIGLGGTPIGAPIIGWVADAFGPRWGLGIGAAGGFAAAIAGLAYLLKYRRLHMRIDAGRLRVTRSNREIADAGPPAPSTASSIMTPAPKGKTMSLTTLDTNAALIVIDLQKGIVDLPSVHPASDVVDRSAKLARAFRAHGLPVVLVNVTGRAPGRTDAGVPERTFKDDWTQLVPELDQQPGDHIVSKQRLGAFAGTSLDAYLRQRGVTQVVLTGVATSSGVESTARSAYDLGYNVALVVDAMTDRNADAHRHSVETIFPRLGEAGTTEHVLKLLQQAPANA